eukprot:m.134761 g.134761  ORF g.134761 m.134761 type:complete len:67 (-) comp15978_c0_seq4:51-251(-)
MLVHIRSNMYHLPDSSSNNEHPEKEMMLIHDSTPHDHPFPATKSSVESGLAACQQDQSLTCQNWQI